MPTVYVWRLQSRARAAFLGAVPTTSSSALIVLRATLRRLLNCRPAAWRLGRRFKACVQEAPAECMEPVLSSECTDEDLVFREHSFFFEDGNCTRYTGGKCLYGPNRFTTAEQCQQACLVTNDPSCRVPRFLGACRSSQKRFGFHYDHSLSACIPWRTACLAGPNRHESLAACADTCEKNFFKRLAGAF